MPPPLFPQVLEAASRRKKNRHNELLQGILLEHAGANRLPEKTPSLKLELVMLAHFQNYHIRNKLLLVALVSSIPVIVTVVILLLSKYRTDYRNAERAIQGTAEAIAAQHEAHIDGIKTLLITLSQFPEVRNRNAEGCKRLLHGILGQNPSSHNIGIADADGNLIASGIDAKFTIGDRKYFRDAVRTKRFSVGEYTISRAVGKPAIHFALPVLDGAGNVNVVIYATFDLRHFDDIFAAQKLPPNSALNITDHKGVLLYRYPEHTSVKPGLQDRPDLRAHMTGAGAQGVFEDFGRDNIKRLLGFKRLQLHSDEPPYMYIRVSIPLNEALGSVHRHLAMAVALLVAGSLITLWCTRLFSGRFFVAPLERLATIAKSAEHADFSVRSGLSHTNDEIGFLARAFDTMSESLEKRSREKELAEKELDARNRLFDTLLANLPVGVFMVEAPSGKPLVANEKALELLGRGLLPETTTEALSEVYEAYRYGTRERYPIHEMPIVRGMYGESARVDDLLVVRPDGETRLIEVAGAPVRDSDGNIVASLVCFQDITHRKEREKERIRVEKLESLGVLAGGIAHDFNNILTAIVGNISFAQIFLDAGHRSYQPLKEAEKGSMRAAELAHQLLTFARGGEPVKKEISIGAVVRETVSLVLRGTNVKCAVHIPDSIHAIEADEGQISQVCSNIIINATHAMPGGGTLRITAENEALGDSNPCNLPAGTYVRLSFADEGCGVSPDDQKRIFDPYYTTKLNGSGLGLASALSIVSRHRGHIGIRSAPGKGATFDIHLPSLDRPPRTERTGEPVDTAGSHAGGAVLVMDDEEMILTLARNILEHLGYRVTTCSDGESAIAEYQTARERGTPFSAVIMDLTIPGGMGGIDAGRKILDLDSSACLIVSSGYSDDAVMADFRKYGFSGAVAKPYRVAQLAQLLDSLLASV